MRNEHVVFTEVSGRLAVTGTMNVLQKDLQPGFQSWDFPNEFCPIDAPSFTPGGSVIEYDGRPLQNLKLIDRRMA